MIAMFAMLLSEMYEGFVLFPTISATVKTAKPLSTQNVENCEQRSITKRWTGYLGQRS